MLQLWYHRAQMTTDLAQFQAEAIARGYTHDFGIDGESLSEICAANPHVVASESFDLGTDPGDDVTIFLIEAECGNGYLIVSDSFHADPVKAALIDRMLSRN
jgi:hypothetical protein